MSKKLLKSTSVVVSMTSISRVFGFLRDMISASFFGAGASYDAFAVAFKIPNFMRRLFAEGSFSQAFVPVLAEYQKNKSEEEVKHFIGAMCGSLGAVLLLVTLLGIWGAPWVIRVFAPGFEAEGPRFDLAVTMLRITFPYLMLISLTAFSGAILNTNNKFWVAAFTPVFLNISMITATIWLSPRMATPIIALAWGVFVAGIVQLLFQGPFLARLKMMPRPRLDFSDPGVRRVLRLMVPALFGVSVAQVNLLVDTLFASLLAVGSVSWLYYSDRLMEFPLGVFGVAISTVILPNLSRAHAGHAGRQFSLTLDWALRTVLLIGLPAAMFLALSAGPLLSTLFQYGRFDAEDVQMSRLSLMAFALGIAPFMLVKILASGFYARQNLKTPVKIAAIAMLANIVFNVMLIGPLKHAGIALATSLSAILNISMLLYFLLRYGIYEPRDGWGLYGIRLVLANAALAVWLWYDSGNLQDWLTNNAWWRVSHLAVLFLGAAVIYVAVLLLSGVRPRHLLVPQEA